MNDVYADADAVYAAALEMAGEIAANAPLAVRGTKFILQQGEAMQAFMEKRPANFTGS